MITDSFSAPLSLYVHVYTCLCVGFVGLFNTVLLLPLVLIWHYMGLEEFEWPPTPDIWTLLLVNGFIGTVISELVWLG